MAGHRRFVYFTIVAAEAGLADGYPGATKARTIVWAFTFVVSFVLHTFRAYSVLYCMRPRGHEAPEGECSKHNTPWKACSNQYLLNSVLVGM